MGKTQSKQKITTTTKSPAPSANQGEENNDAGAKKNEPKDLIISFNADFTEVDVKKEKRVQFFPYFVISSLFLYYIHISGNIFIVTDEILFRTVRKRFRNLFLF